MTFWGHAYPQQTDYARVSNESVPVATRRIIPGLVTNYSEHVQLPDVKAQVGKVKARQEFSACHSPRQDPKNIRTLKSHFQ
ncbi:hypothetical protein JTE90_021853 [Oedothorax gibbosus]|uniref:Uncharacterized protein n=1 Tax=Oedothorax gibbosus TaxID=931172 RepID=A0AAV6V0I5_9ARAC|nr:hypothetical protein JTE90_021853 [Oedothorax gibbosus]